MNATVLGKLHETMLELLEEVVRICEAHGLTYFLIGGTLLGAVRHKGFIPWDDDLDIVMPRADYERFIDLCGTQLGDAYYLNCYRTNPNYGKLLGRLCKKNTVYHLSSGPEAVNDQGGIRIDIFPLDDAKRPRGLQMLQSRLLKWLDTMARVRRGEWKAGLVKRLLSRLLGGGGVRARQQRIMQWANGKGCLYYTNFGSQYGVKKQTIPKERFHPPAEVEFEGRRFSGLRDNEYYFKRIYGDNYMTPPPPEKRARHTVVRLSFDLGGPDEVLD
jgi:lipopolysaccharide cholinephosphotransferase